MKSIKSRFEAVLSAFDVRDFFVFLGIASLFYGFYLFKPCLGFVSAGAILLYMGLFHGSVTVLLLNGRAKR